MEEALLKKPFQVGPVPVKHNCIVLVGNFVARLHNPVRQVNVFSSPQAPVEAANLEQNTPAGRPIHGYGIWRSVHLDRPFVGVTPLPEMLNRTTGPDSGNEAPAD